MLFDPIKVGNVQLQHRVVLAPLTRCRAQTNNVHSDLAIEYYRQRAAEPGTLLISEASPIHHKAGGVPRIPGIWSDDQAQQWSKITSAVHKERSSIFLQMWAVGRKQYRNQGIEITAPSSITMEDGRDLGQSTPRALTIPEIEQYITWYAEAARRAINIGGFDGVEIHAANGYLIEQFMRSCTNQRDDKYGGNILNRTLFARQIVDAVVAAVGDQALVGIRLSPWTRSGDMGPDEETLAEYSFLLGYLQKHYPNLAYVSIVEPRVAHGHWTDDVSVPDTPGLELDDWNQFVRLVWHGNLIRAGALVHDAEKLAAKDDKLLIAIGRYFIANPDLVKRLKNRLELAKYDRATFYTGGEKGYTDYPFTQH